MTLLLIALGIGSTLGRTPLAMRVLPGILVLSLFPLISAPAFAQISNVCGTVEISYEHQEGCKIYRNAKNIGATNICVDMPGLSAKTCDAAEYGSTQGHVATVEIATGPATVKICSGTECSGTGQTCDVTYLKVKTYKQLQQNEFVENGLLDSLENPIVAFNCVWNGSTIFYNVVNNSSIYQTINWVSTPFHNVTIAPHSQQTRMDHETSVGLAERAVTVVDGSGHYSFAPATTLIATTSTAVPEEPTSGLTFLGAWPNPASRDVQFSLSLDRLVPVRITVYDVAGREIAQPVEDEFLAGYVTRTWRPQALPNGIYYVNARLGGHEHVRKLIWVAR